MQRHHISFTFKLILVSAVPGSQLASALGRETYQSFMGILANMGLQILMKQYIMHFKRKKKKKLTFSWKL